MALMLVPRDLLLFRSKAAQNKTPIIPRHLRTSRQPVRNHFTLKRYRIDTRYHQNCSGETKRVANSDPATAGGDVAGEEKINRTCLVLRPGLFASMGDDFYRGLMAIVWPPSSPSSP